MRHAVHTGYLLVAVASLMMVSQMARAAGEEMSPLTEQQKIVHVLNRLGFGPKPGDVERVEKMGLREYIQQQLHPETIAESPALEQALQPLDTLHMSSGHLMKEYFADIRRFLARQQESGDPAEMKMRYGIDMKRVHPTTTTSNDGPPKPADMVKWDALRCMGELQEAKLLRATLSEKQLAEVLTDFWENHFNIDIKKNQCRALEVADDRDVIRPHVLGHFRELLGASAHSPAMLAYLDNTENSVARVRSDFENAMVSSYISSRLGVDPKGLMSTHEGPNENYGREILELHTLGVDGGYTQKDVQEVARCFSGWAQNPFEGSFQFTPHRHDRGEKVVLGHTIAAGGGESDGEKVLDILATHPSTAKYISRKLCQRFVLDDPSIEMVERISKVFSETDGDIRAVVSAIIASPEFFSRSAYRSKIKSPFEYAVSAVRASDGKFVQSEYPNGDKLRHVIEGAGVLGYGGDKLSSAKRKSLNWHVYDMGEPLFDCAPPTGYTENSSKWVNPGALIDRLNFAVALTQQEVTDARIETSELLKGVDADQPQAVFDRLANTLLHGEIHQATRATIMKTAVPQGESKTVDVARLAALLLGSPEFQRR